MVSNEQSLSFFPDHLAGPLINTGPIFVPKWRFFGENKKSYKAFTLAVNFEIQLSGFLLSPPLDGFRSAIKPFALSTSYKRHREFSSNEASSNYESSNIIHQVKRVRNVSSSKCF